MAIEVLRVGPLTTVQDLGRTGHVAQGYPECGACDAYAARLANLLCGNPEGLAVLECTLSGPRLRFEAPAVAALTGAAMRAELDGGSCPWNEPFYVPAGGVLEIGAFSSGLRGYVAVRGGIDVPEYLGSRATDLKSRLGGFAGRALREGDRLPARPCAEARLTAAALAERARKIDQSLFFPAVPRGWLGEEGLPILRAVPGPQEECFAGAGLEAFARGIYAVSPDSNRMAARLTGAKIAAEAGVDIVSDGIVAGSVQVSADGQPIVMLADHQTTGGYAKIATVLPCDLPALAQLRPGERLRFRLVSRAEGLAALRWERQRLDDVRRTMVPDQKG